MAAGEPLMSLFWLAPQFFMLGTTETTFFVGSSSTARQAHRGMKSIDRHRAVLEPYRHGVTAEHDAGAGGHEESHAARW
ncbi:hypothetical protein PR202_gb28584 [Eleusine coracana subsp. coracana]|uniref:Uncharacterized protein n=1 Tax=Eleusine coracana subsp. coracana TaxID=191504 RepID=A0AAV5FUR5_ELECO|nr:hypothetical protein PR202_gb28584 [Eleusine coracana subsp. coracana]